MTMFNNNQGEGSNFVLQNQSSASAINLLPSINQGLRPSSVQRQMITGLYFYRSAGGATVQYSISIRDLALDVKHRIIITPGLAGGEWSYECTDMIYLGQPGETLGVFFNAGDVVTIRARVHYTLI